FAEGLVELSVVRGVQRRQPRISDPERLDGPPRPPLILLSGEVGERQPGALLVQGLGDVPRVRAVIGDPNDQPRLSFEQSRHHLLRKAKPLRLGPLPRGCGSAPLPQPTTYPPRKEEPCLSTPHSPGSPITKRIPYSASRSGFASPASPPTPHIAS